MFKYEPELKKTDNWIQNLEKMHADKLIHDVYLVSYLNPYEILNHVKDNLSSIQRCKQVIIKTNCEAPFYTIWFELCDWLYSIGFTKENILIIDAGESPPDDIISWKHLGLPIICYPLRQKISIKKNKIFVSLARVPRNYRVIFTLELLKLGLYDSSLKHSIISCGSAKENSGDVLHWNWLIPEKYRNIFPIVPFGVTSQQQGVIDGINYEEFSTALINVIQETGFDSSFILYPKTQDEIYSVIDIKYLSETWDRKTFTEKTFKCFDMRQIPLFLSVPGYVSYVRSLGFDVFDDFVNHSYDMELNSLLRMKKVALELNRLHKLLLEKNTEDYGQCVTNFEERVENNYKIATEMDHKFFDIEMKTINNFLSEL